MPAGSGHEHRDGIDSEGGCAHRQLGTRDGTRCFTEENSRSGHIPLQLERSTFLFDRRFELVPIESLSGQILDMTDALQAFALDRGGPKLGRYTVI